MYLPCQFDILIHFHSSEHPISNYHFTHKNNTLTLDILQGERQITWVNSYVFTRCTIVHDVCHAITHSRHLHSLVTKGYNAAFLFMESSLDTISSSSSIIQQHLILLDTYVKHENQKHVNRQSNLIMEICYIGLTDFQCFDLLSNKKSISNEQILSYGLDRYMKPWTTTLDLTHILTTDDNIPKLLAMKITDHVSVSSYLYYLDLQQPYNNTLYPLSSSFTSLVSFLDQVETRKEKVGSNNDCVLIYLLRDYLVGRHHAIMFLDLEKHPHATDLPSIDQSLSLIQRLSSIQGFTSQNQINHFTIQINEQQLHDEQERHAFEIQALEERYHEHQIAQKEKLSVANSINKRNEKLLLSVYEAQKQLKDRLDEEMKERKYVEKELTSSRYQNLTLQEKYHSLQQELTELKYGRTLSSEEWKQKEIYIKRLEHLLQEKEQNTKSLGKLAQSEKKKLEENLRATSEQLEKEQNETVYLRDLLRQERNQVLLKRQQLRQKIDIDLEERKKIQQLEALIDQQRNKIQNYMDDVKRLRHQITQHIISENKMKLQVKENIRNEQEQMERHKQTLEHEYKEDIRQLNLRLQKYQQRVRGLEIGNTNLLNQKSILERDIINHQKSIDEMKDKIKSLQEAALDTQVTMEKTKIALQTEQKWNTDQEMILQSERMILLQWIELVRMKWMESMTNKKKKDAPDDGDEDYVPFTRVVATQFPDSLLPSSLRNRVPIYAFTNDP